MVRLEERVVDFRGDGFTGRVAGGLAECAIVFKVGFVEPLIGSGIVRERFIGVGVCQDIRGIAPNKSGLDIDDSSVLGGKIWVVANFTDGKMGLRAGVG